MRLVSLRNSLFFVLILGIAFFTSGCGNLSLGYTPPFAPIMFALDASGNISISGNISVVTPLGSFSIGTDIFDTQQPQDNSILLVIRHQQDGSVVDTAYQINTQEQVIVDLDGRSTIDVTNQRVMIDASQGDISCIEVKDISSDSSCDQPPPTTEQTQPPAQTCSNSQGQEGPPHQADGTNWTIDSLNGGAFIVNFYFPSVQQYSGNNKVFVPEGYTSVTFIQGGGSYWLYQVGCATNAQQDFNTLDSYPGVNLQDLINQGLVTVN